MKVELLWITPDPLKVIEEGARETHDNLEKVGTKKDFVQKVLQLGHFSILEHACCSFRITEVSRSLTHQLVRHRVASYLQLTQRHVSQSDFTYVTPDTICDKAMKFHYENVMTLLADAYSHLISKGVPKQDARYVLPNACHTKIRMTGNFRMWFEVLQKRLDLSAQWEIRDLFVKIYDKLHKEVPEVFNRDVLMFQPIINLDERVR